MRPLSIGIVTPTVSRAGGGIFPIVLAHARAFISLGNAVTVHGIDCDQEKLDRADWDGIKLSLHPQAPFGYAPRLLSTLVEANHDIIHQHGLWLYPSIVVSQWRARVGRPTVISTQGMLEPWALSNSRVKKKIAGALFEKKNLRSANAVHCSVNEIKGVRSYAESTPIAAIANGVILPDRRSSLQKPSNLFSDGRKTLLFLGRIHPKKGIAELLRAFSIFKAEEPVLASQWRLVVAGWDDGNHAEDLNILARKLGMGPEDVTFPGPFFGDDKDALLFHSDAFILPSFSEGFPMAVLEAWAHSLPVLMTNECNIPDGFTHGAAIKISNNPHELAITLAKSLARCDLQTIGAAGRKLVESQYSWSALGSELVSVYHWLLAQGRRPSCVQID